MAGAFESFNWALWEVMDNVLQHSEASEGFLEVQVHPQTSRLAVCVADAGQGVLASLRGSSHRPRSHVDALTLAIEEGVTRDNNTNQGNGLWGLAQIVQDNKGVLNLMSGRGQLVIDESEITTNSFGWAPSRDTAGTIIDFQLDVSQPIDLIRAIGHDSTTIAAEKFQTLGGSGSLLSVRDHSHGTGTRRSASELRTLAINLLTSNGPELVVDFESVPIISSSFADEFIGQMVVRLGFVRFGSEVRLVNLNPTVSSLVDRAVSLRLAAQRDT